MDDSFEKPSQGKGFLGFFALLTNIIHERLDGKQVFCYFLCEKTRVPY
jgi:hypothetical protein